MKKLFFIFTLILFIASCTNYAAHKTGLTDEEMLSERVRLFWEAKKMRDWETVKDFVDPDIRQDWSPYFESLKKKLPVGKFISHNIKAINIEGEKATVLSDVDIKLTHPLLETLPVQKKVIKDHWIKRDGIWYVIMQRPDLSQLLDSLRQKEGR